MRLFIIFLTIILTTISTFTNAADCPDGVRIRKDFRDMPIEEWNEFLTAMKIMRETRGPNGISRYEEVIRLHSDFMSEAHSNANFGFWHRVLLKRLEDSLRAVNPRFKALPYWNWSADYALPHKSRIWDPQYLGGSSSNGITPQRSCVPTGPLAGFQYNYPDRYCLSRGFSQVTGRSTAYPDGEQVRFNSPPELTQLITNVNDFQRFHDALQYTVHAVPHIYIGGAEGEMFFVARSPADPAFFLHHAFVDLLLDRWQRQHNTFQFPEAPFNAWSGSKSSDAWNLDSTCVQYQPYSAFEPPPPVVSSTVPPSRTVNLGPLQQPAPSTPVISVQLPTQTPVVIPPVTITVGANSSTSTAGVTVLPTNVVIPLLPTNVVIPQVPLSIPPQSTTVVIPQVPITIPPQSTSVVIPQVPITIPPQSSSSTTLPSSQSLPSSVSNPQSTSVSVNFSTPISTVPQSSSVTTLPSSPLFSSSVSNPQSSPVVVSSPPSSNAPLSTPIQPATVPVVNSPPSSNAPLSTPIQPATVPAVNSPPSSNAPLSTPIQPATVPVVNSPPSSDPLLSTPIPPATIPTTEQSRFNKDTFYNTPGCPYLPPPNTFLPALPQRFIEKNMYPEDKVRATLDMVQKITRVVKEQAQKGIYFPPIVKITPGKIDAPQKNSTPLIINDASTLPILNGLIVFIIAILLF